MSACHCAHKSPLCRESPKAPHQNFTTPLQGVAEIHNIPTCKKQWDVSFHCTFAKQNYPLESNVFVNHLQLPFHPFHVMSSQTRPHFNTIMSIDQLHAYVSLSIQASVSVSYSLVSLVSSYC